MNKSIAKKWVKELRSGRYEQGVYRLVDNKDNFCCLGVLCNLAIDEGIGKWVKGSSGWAFRTAADIDDQILPLEVRKWAGMYSSSGMLNDGTLECLTDLNDAGKSFKQLADIIENNVERL